MLTSAAAMLAWFGQVQECCRRPKTDPTSDPNFRDKLLRDGVVVAEGDALHFTRDHLCRSPSMAAVALLGRTANGWREWKTDDG